MTVMFLTLNAVVVRFMMLTNDLHLKRRGKIFIGRNNLCCLGDLFTFCLVLDKNLFLIFIMRTSISLKVKVYVFVFLSLFVHVTNLLHLSKTYLFTKLFGVSKIRKVLGDKEKMCVDTVQFRKSLQCQN